MLAHLRPGFRLAKLNFLSTTTTLASDNVVFSSAVLSSCFYSSLSSGNRSNSNDGTESNQFSPSNLHERFSSLQLQRNLNDSRFGRRSFVRVSPTELYDIMGLTQKDTTELIKATYFKLSKVYHPDVCKDPAGVEKFVLISKAYEVLGNEEKRREYDRGIYSLDNATGQGAARATREFSHEEVLRYQDIFNQHHDLPKAKRTQYVQKGKRLGVYDFDEYYKQHYMEERRDKASQAGFNDKRNHTTETIIENRKKMEKQEMSPELTLAKKIGGAIVYFICVFSIWYSGVMTDIF